MASGDTPKRRAAPLAATDSATDVDESTDPRGRRPTESSLGVERATAGAEQTLVSPMPDSERGQVAVSSGAAASPSATPGRRVGRAQSSQGPRQQTNRRDDTTAWPDEMPAREERPREARMREDESRDDKRRRAQPRTTEIYAGGPANDPDVVGAPERTVIAPLPPQDESVDPLPMPRAAPRNDEDRARRAGHEARGRARDADDDRDRAQTSGSDGRPRRRGDNERSAARDRNDDRSRPERGPDSARARRPRRDEPDNALVRQNTRAERVGAEGPWRRLRIAARDVWVASVLAVKHHWGVLRSQGPRPYIDAARPYVQRAWLFVQQWAIRAKIVAVKSAVRVGLVKPRRIEYEFESSDRVDRARADAWRRFHDGRKSSSYLQDDE